MTSVRASSIPANLPGALAEDCGVEVLPRLDYGSTHESSPVSRASSMKLLLSCIGPVIAAAGLLCGSNTADVSGAPRVRAASRNLRVGGD